MVKGADLIDHVASETGMEKSAARKAVGAVLIGILNLAPKSLLRALTRTTCTRSFAMQRSTPSRRRTRRVWKRWPRRAARSSARFPHCRRYNGSCDRRKLRPKSSNSPPVRRRGDQISAGCIPPPQVLRDDGASSCHARRTESRHRLAGGAQLQLNSFLSAPTTRSAACFHSPSNSCSFPAYFVRCSAACCLIEANCSASSRLRRSNASP